METAWINFLEMCSVFAAFLGALAISVFAGWLGVVHQKQHTNHELDQLAFTDWVSTIANRIPLSSEWSNALRDMHGLQADVLRLDAELKQAESELAALQRGERQIPQSGGFPDACEDIMLDGAFLEHWIARLTWRKKQFQKELRLLHEHLTDWKVGVDPRPQPESVEVRIRATAIPSTWWDETRKELLLVAGDDSLPPDEMRDVTDDGMDAEPTVVVKRPGQSQKH